MNNIVIFFKIFLLPQIPEDGHYRISFSGVVGSEDEGYATLVLLDDNANNLAVVEMGKNKMKRISNTIIKMRYCRFESIY